MSQPHNNTKMKGGAASLFQIFRFENAFGGDTGGVLYYGVRNVRVDVRNAIMTGTDAKYIIVYDGIDSAV